MILAAEQHDVTWLCWETAPTFDRETGLPHPFTKLGPAVHAPMWARGVEIARAAYGLWPALLISLHGTRVYTEYMDPESLSPEDHAAIDHNAAKEAAIQADWIAKLDATPDQIQRNSAPIAVTDALSFALCLFGPERMAVPAGTAEFREETIKATKHH